MAKKKSSLSRSNGDKFLLKVSLIFGGVFVVLIAALLIYNATKVTHEYEDFDAITDFSEVLKQDEDKYLIYYYSESCGYCQQIKDTVLDFAFENNADMKVYLVDAYNVEGDTNPFEGLGTPSMFVVEDGAITATFRGASDIPNALGDINDGSYEFEVE